MLLGIANNEQSHANSSDFHAQYTGVAPDTLVTSKQPLSLYPDVSNSSSQPLRSSQIDQQGVNTQPHLLNHVMNTNYTTARAVPGYMERPQAHPTHSQSTLNQTPYNIGGIPSERYNQFPAISTLPNSTVPGPGAGYMSNYSPQDQTAFTAPQLNGQSLNQSFSNLTFADHAPAPAFPSYFHEAIQRIDSYGSRSESSFSTIIPTTESPSRKGIRQVKKAFNGFDRQLNGILNDDRSGRGLLNSGQTNLPAVAKKLQARRNTQI